MKLKASIIIAMAMLSTIVFSQNDEAVLPKAFIGVSSGINNMNGIMGFNGEVNIVDNLSAYGAAGIGGWGTKLSIGIKYYRDYPFRTYYALGYSVAGGLMDFTTPLETASGSTEDVTLDLDKGRNLNFMIGYGWKLFNKGRFHIDFGYSLAFDENIYTVTSNHVLSETSEAVMKALVPGGLIVGLGFSVGL